VPISLRSIRWPDRNAHFPYRGDGSTELAADRQAPRSDALHRAPRADRLSAGAIISNRQYGIERWCAVLELDISSRLFPFS
jgi:hypothetical protein